MSVGSCFSRGFRRKRAPVSITRAHLSPLEQPPQPLGPLATVAGVGRQGRVIDGDRDALIADVGQQLDRIEQVVVRHAVGVVAEKHC